VFVEQKRQADFLATFLSQMELPTTSIHGYIALLTCCAHWKEVWNIVCTLCCVVCTCKELEAAEIMDQQKIAHSLPPGAHTGEAFALCVCHVDVLCPHD